VAALVLAIFGEFNRRPGMAKESRFYRDFLLMLSASNVKMAILADISIYHQSKVHNCCVIGLHNHRGSCCKVMHSLEDFG